MKARPFMKQHLLQWLSSSEAAARQRRGRPAVVVGAAVLLWWTYLVLGDNLPWLVIAVAGAAIAGWILRDHRQVAACCAIAIATAAVLAITCVIIIDRQVPGTSDAAAVLTGFLIAAPIPAAVACTLRPTLVSMPLNAACGSGVLLLGALPTVVLGDHGEGPVLAVTALMASVVLIWRRHRRAAAARLEPLPLVNGWTDLGRRTLPNGTYVEQLLIGHGLAIACSTAALSTPEKAAFTAAHTAAATATALGLAARRVQPVVLIERESAHLKRVLVNDGDIAASVIVTDRRKIEEVTQLAPRHHRNQRRTVLTAALLPSPAIRAETR